MFLRRFTIICLFVILGFTAACKDQPYPGELVIAALGDSLTAGYGIGEAHAFPAQLQKRLRADGYERTKVLNFGISGDTTKGGLVRLGDVLEAEPDIVILALGANDLLRSAQASDTAANLETIITRLKQDDVTVILAGIKPPAIFSLGNDNLAEYTAMYEAMSQTHSLLLYENFLEGAIGNSTLMLPDRLHPNPDGVAVMVEGIYPLVIEAITDHVEARE